MAAAEVYQIKQVCFKSKNNTHGSLYLGLELCPTYLPKLVKFSSLLLIRLDRRLQLLRLVEVNTTNQNFFSTI